MRCHSTQRLGLLSLLLAALVLPATLAGCSTDDGQGGASAIKSIAISITNPKADTLNKGVVVIDGTVTPDDGVTDVEVICTVKGVQIGKSGAGKFSFSWDTLSLDAKGNPAFKDGKLAISLTATGSAGATGTAARTVVVDNTAPVITIDTPTTGDVTIGKLQVRGSINDKNIALAGIYLDNDSKPYVGWCNKKAADGAADACDTCEAASPSGKCLSGNGPFEFVLDRAGLPTANVTVKVAAADLTGTQSIVSATAKVLKAPEFEVADSSPSPEIGIQLALRTSDVNGDGVVDAVIGTEKGAWVRYGVTDGGETAPKGIGQFGPPVPLVGERRCPQIVRTDLDGDGTLDHIAVCNLADGVNSAATVVLSRKGGPKVLETRTFPGNATAAAAADIDGDDQADLVVGAAETEHALTVLHLLTTPLCPSPDAADRACKDATDGASIQGGKVFAAETQALQFTGGIRSIVTADFFAGGDSAGYLDVALGRGDLPVLTTCRNDKGKLLGCIDTPDNSWVADLTDTSLLAQPDWNADGKADLIVGSRGNGVVRWLSGNGDGTFTYLPNSYRYFVTNSVNALEIHPVGPAGEDYLVVLTDARVITMIPVSPADNTHKLKCFRTFVLGGAIGAIAPADFDNDGKLDMIAMDNGPIGLGLARGKGDGNFEAAAVHRVCGSPPDARFVFSSLEVARFVLDDVSADGKPDLLMISTNASSMLNYCKKDDSPTAAWHMHLYLNDKGALNEYARAGEISPYTSLSNQNISGIRSDNESAPCGRTMPPIVGMATGEFGGGVGRDLALAINIDYTLGGDPLVVGGKEAGGGDGPNLECIFREYYEVVNFFGEETPDGIEPGSPQACKNFSDKKLGETEKPKPLVGYGQGAPWERASLFTFLGGAVENPFNLSPAGTPGNPTNINPYYAQAAGTGAIGVAVGNFDGDPYDDVAMVMPRRGDDTATTYLHSRVRMFKSDGQGKLRAVLITSESDNEATKIAADFNVDSSAIEFVTVPNKQAKDSWVQKKIDGAIKDYIPTTYRTLGDDPVAVAPATPYCSDPLDSVFTIGSKNGNVQTVRALGGMKFDSKLPSPGAENLTAFDVQPFDTEDTCTDLLYATPKLFGFYRGASSGFQENTLVPAEIKNAVAVKSADLNEDGLLDLMIVDGDHSSVEIFLGDGTGTFHRLPHGLLAMGVASRIEKADLDGDGCPELAVQGTYGVAIFRNLGCN